MNDYDQTDQNDGSENPIEAQAAEASNFDGFDAGGGAMHQLELEQRVREGVRHGHPTYTPSPTIVDAVSLVKAQGRFINEQTRFLMAGFNTGTHEYLESLTRYSRAQTALIDAMQTALHQADVILWRSSTSPHTTSTCTASV
jgi:hypothetical protein